MNTQKIEEYLKKLEENHDRYALLTILNVPNRTIASGPYQMKRQEKMKVEIRKCLPNFSATTIEEMANKSHELSNLMTEKIEDEEISSELQTLIEVTIKEHIVSSFDLFLDELKEKQTIG